MLSNDNFQIICEQRAGKKTLSYSLISTELTFHILLFSTHDIWVSSPLHFGIASFLIHSIKIISSDSMMWCKTTIFDHFRSFLTLFDNSWSLSTISDLSRSFSTGLGHFWSSSLNFVKSYYFGTFYWNNQIEVILLSDRFVKCCFVLNSMIDLFSKTELKKIVPTKRWLAWSSLLTYMLQIASWIKSSSK